MVAVSRPSPHLLSENYLSGTSCGRDKETVSTTVISCDLITGINYRHLEIPGAYLPALDCVSSQPLSGW